MSNPQPTESETPGKDYLPPGWVEKVHGGSGPWYWMPDGGRNPLIEVYLADAPPTYSVRVFCGHNSAGEHRHIVEMRDLSAPDAFDVAKALAWALNALLLGYHEEETEAPDA